MAITGNQRQKLPSAYAQSPKPIAAYKPADLLLTKA